MNGSTCRALSLLELLDQFTYCYAFSINNNEIITDKLRLIKIPSAKNMYIQIHKRRMLVKELTLLFSISNWTSLKKNLQFLSLVAFNCYISIKYLSPRLRKRLWNVYETFTKIRLKKFTNPAGWYINCSRSMNRIFC